MIEQSNGAALKTYRAGDIVFREGDTGTCAYIVRDGIIDIQREGRAGATLLGSIKAGEVFGEIALMTEQPRTATAVARTDTVLEEVDRSSLVQLFTLQPTLAYQIVSRLAGVVTAQKVELLSAKESGHAPEDDADEDDADQDMSAFPWFERIKRKLGFGTERQEAAFAPDYLKILKEKPAISTRLTGWAILAFLITGLLWATFAQVDVVVNGRGKLLSVVPPISVQPTSQGTIRELLVRNGQVVHKGDVIAVLDGTASAADLQSVRSELRAVEATIIRLQADVDGTRPEQFSPDPSENEVQTRLFESRRLRLAATLAGADTDIASLTEQINREKIEAKVLFAQVAQQQQVTNIRKDFFNREKDLYRREGPNQLQYLDAEQRLLSLQRDAAAATKRIATLEAQLQRSLADRTVTLNEAASASNSELADALRERARLSEQLKKTELAFAQVRLSAPYDAVVFDVADKTNGSYVQPGETLANLVSLESPLEVGIDVNPNDIPFITPGDEVMVKFDALPFTKHGMANGALRLISDGTFDKTLAGEQKPVYRAWASLEPAQFKDVPADFRLIPGMTAAADIKVGKRRVISFFIYPLVRSLSSSLRER